MLRLKPEAFSVCANAKKAGKKRVTGPIVAARQNWLPTEAPKPVARNPVAGNGVDAAPVFVVLNPAANCVWLKTPKGVPNVVSLKPPGAYAICGVPKLLDRNPDAGCTRLLDGAPNAVEAKPVAWSPVKNEASAALAVGRV